MKKTDHPFRKKWGQNFLADGNLLDKIVRTVDPQKSDSIFEIGPGEGALTERIFSKAGEMAAIEIDPMLIEYLQNRDSLKGLHAELLAIFPIILHHPLFFGLLSNWIFGMMPLL